MTYIDDILELFRNSRECLCDDCVAALCNMKVRQQANSRCIALADAGTILRRPELKCARCGKTKICNRGTANTPRVVAPANKAAPPSKPWFWEGNVQRVIVAWLEGGGWQVTEYANTAAKTPGTDIVAERDDRTLWVSVKGFPEGTAKTSRSTQARHWYAHGMFDLLRYRTGSRSIELALGLPDCSVTYRRLADKSKWALCELPAKIFWVSEYGKVECQEWR